MSSLVKLFVQQPIARESVIVGSTLFAGFSVFWSTLAFRLETPPYHYGSQMAGLFGLVGVVGALAAKVAGYWADHHEPRGLLRIYAACGVLSFVCFWAFGHSIWGLIAGVILLDAGVQGGSTCNQTRNYRAVPWAQNRVNTVYMTIFFAGGSVGTTIGTHAWQHFGYTGVCIAGIVLVCISGLKVLLPLGKSPEVTDAV
jgi:predicted MFS family arabinose efflux permease